MSPSSLQLLHSLMLGFAVAGLFAALYRALAEKPASFRLLQTGGVGGVLAVPFLAFAAPAIIMRNTIRGRRIHNRRFEFVFLATLIAGVWSLMSGRVVSMVLVTAGL
ncbi:DUF6949 family protein [Phreatobacter sp. AB_2022a]|uniref:DUF6949 family protein n=1 Tax=Phreatobacter sp. AB_2022a TaxID=3003134 RepID=UPI00057173F8|nr:hypothetical protein [Phreatobacter sp. AB_2022a]MCZ0736505.1 hypothetical protein [Phreatobacter sp. AB_2022a]CEJ13626.1 hypothetical protein BN1110_03949 [bacterium YEK0313]